MNAKPVKASPPPPSDNQAAPAPSSSGNKRGRKPSLPVSEKVAALRAQLAQAEAEERQAKKEQAAIVGAALIEAMRESGEFKASALVHLKAKVKTPKDKASIAELLI